MQDRSFKNPKIAFIWNNEIAEILGRHEPVKKVTGVRLRDTNSGALLEMDVDGVFIAIGHKPNTELFKDWLDMDEHGYLKVEPFSTRTKIPGVFASGDVIDRHYRQAVTAAGTGCMAAMDAEKLLEAEGR
jgi:thioredoxin reductase (NADPH)